MIDSYLVVAHHSNTAMWRQKKAVLGGLLYDTETQNTDTHRWVGQLKEGLLTVISPSNIVMPWEENNLLLRATSTVDTPYVKYNIHE